MFNDLIIYKHVRVHYSGVRITKCKKWTHNLYLHKILLMAVHFGKRSEDIFLTLQKLFHTCLNIY